MFFVCGLVGMSQMLLAQMQGVGLSLNERLIVHDIDFDVHKGETLTLIGPNGAGKSTVVKLLLGLMQPTQGKVWRKKALKIGYVPQRFKVDQLMPLTVDRFVCLGLKGITPVQVENTLKEVGVPHLCKQGLQALSGGEMQRVLLARALLNQPELLVLDEPGQGVDVLGLSELYQLLADLKKHHHYAVVMVSHDLHLVMNSTDRVLCLNQHICCSGHPEAVTAHPEYLQLFGKQEDISGLAVYTHNHDHQHLIQGDVVQKGCSHG